MKKAESCKRNRFVEEFGIPRTIRWRRKRIGKLAIKPTKSPFKSGSQQPGPLLHTRLEPSPSDSTQPLGA